MLPALLGELRFWKPRISPAQRPAIGPHVAHRKKHAILLVLNRKAADYSVFNVGGGKPWTVNAFFETMQKVVGKTITPVLSGYYRFGDTRHIFSDTSELQSLGWTARRDIEESIQRYWEYISGQNRADDILDYAERHMKKLRVIRKVQPSVS